MSRLPALDAAIDLMNDILHPEGLGHALPQEARIRAYVVRDMLMRYKNRQAALLTLRLNGDEKCPED